MTSIIEVLPLISTREFQWDLEMKLATYKITVNEMLNIPEA
jgi:hypothetical protein